jgi:hypothetical protein
MGQLEKYLEINDIILQEISRASADAVYWRN